MGDPVARAQIDWLTPSEGGRPEPPSGPIYAATARFAEDAEDQLFSVVLHLPSGSSTQQRTGEVSLALLAPELLPVVRQRLVPKTQLLITEGRRVVAQCEIL